MTHAMQNPEALDPHLAEALRIATLVVQVPLREDDGMETVPQWDSLKVMLLASMIEVERGITLDNSEIEKLTSVRAIVEVLAHHGSG